MHYTEVHSRRGAFRCTSFGLPAQLRGGEPLKPKRSVRLEPSLIPPQNSCVVHFQNPGRRCFPSFSSQRTNRYSQAILKPDTPPRRRSGMPTSRHYAVSRDRRRTPASLPRRYHHLGRRNRPGKPEIEPFFTATGRRNFARFVAVRRSASSPTPPRAPG